MKAKFILPLVPVLFLFVQVAGQKLADVKIYVNPGHGGFDSDDRNVPVPPYALGDTAGFWESKSNLVKGLHLKRLLEQAGASVIMSRVQNRTVDDRPLSAIAEEANANQVDFMISVHSNAFNSATNYVLMLFHGWDNNPILPQSMQLAGLFFDNLFSNQAAQWSYAGRQVRGDKSFAPESWNGYGVLRPLTVPGLISEGSFHDYAPETYRLLNREYKQLEAWHFFRAFCQYYGGNPGKKGKIAGYVKDNYRKVADYPYIPDSKDQWLPVNGARVTLKPGDATYTVDQLNNGFYLFDDLEPGTYSLVFDAIKYEPLQADNIRVDSAGVTYYLCYLNQDRSDPLKVEDYGPKPGDSGVVPASSDVVFKFNFEIDTTSFKEAFSMIPPVAGSFAWDDQGRTARFVHAEPFDISTMYSVTLKKTARHIGNLPMKEDFSFSFITAARNRLALLNMYPKNGMESVYPNTQVRLHFDGQLQNAELASRIGIFDMQGNMVNRSGVELNTFPGKAGSYAFSLNDLEPDSSFVLKLDGNLADAEGLKLGTDREIRFKVMPVFQSSLPVAFDFEASALSWITDTLHSKNIAPGTANRILRYGTSKLFGSYSWRLLYSFTADDAHVVVKAPAPLFPVRNGQYAGIYLWGDLSENQLFLLLEKDGEEVEIPFATIDFAGWQFREVNVLLPGSEEVCNFRGFKMRSAGTPFSAGGMIFLDNMIVSDQPMTGIRDVPSPSSPAMTIYPNPARDNISVIVPVQDATYTYIITDVRGVTVRGGWMDVAGNRGRIGVTGLGNGLYILRLFHPGGIVQGIFVIR